MECEFGVKKSHVLVKFEVLGGDAGEEKPLQANGLCHLWWET
jgi:hypothetical protein